MEIGVVTAVGLMNENKMKNRDTGETVKNAFSFYSYVFDGRVKWEKHACTQIETIFQKEGTAYPPLTFVTLKGRVGR